MSCSKLKNPVSLAARYSDEVAFMFDFSRGANLSLVGVDIKNGDPKLQFAPAQNVPTLTEEDVAIIAKLVLQGERPGFFYEGFHPFHPFYGSGRLFKGYRPRYLKGTSIGETLAEVDWEMKCLHVGVRSDKDKKHFQSWNKTSNLRGLQTREDFHEDLPGATIIMTCDSVDVEEEADELYFVGQPKMRIDCVRDGKNLEYSKYITGIFNSVAYHDEPLFLKMQEIVKLVSAMEWLHKKLQEMGMTFSRAWVNKHLNKPRESTSPLVEVVVPPDQAEQLMSEAFAVEEPQEKQVATRNSSVVKLSNKKLSQNGFQADACATVDNETHELKVRRTFNNFDHLFEDLDPNQPTNFDLVNDSIEPQIPNVKSWNELRRETVPCPCTAFYSSKSGLIGPPITGGVSTTGYSTNHVSRTTRTQPEVTVPAGKPVRMKYEDTPKPRTTYCPTKDVGVTTRQSEINSALRGAGFRKGAGHTNVGGSSISMSSENGKVLAERKQLETRVFPSKTPLPSMNCPHQLKELRRDGKEGAVIKEHMRLLPEYVKGENPLVAECAHAYGC